MKCRKCFLITALFVALFVVLSAMPSWAASTRRIAFGNVDLNGYRSIPKNAVVMLATLQETNSEDVIDSLDILVKSLDGTGGSNSRDISIDEYGWKQIVECLEKIKNKLSNDSDGASAIWSNDIRSVDIYNSADRAIASIDIVSADFKNHVLGESTQLSTDITNLTETSPDRSSDTRTGSPDVKAWIQISEDIITSTDVVSVDRRRIWWDALLDRIVSLGGGSGSFDMKSDPDDPNKESVSSEDFYIAYKSLSAEVRGLPTTTVTTTSKDDYARRWENSKTSFDLCSDDFKGGGEIPTSTDISNDITKLSADISALEISDGVTSADNTGDTETVTQNESNGGTGNNNNDNSTDDSNSSNNNGGGGGSTNTNSSTEEAFSALDDGTPETQQAISDAAEALDNAGVDVNDLTDSEKEALVENKKQEAADAIDEAASGSVSDTTVPAATNLVSEISDALSDLSSTPKVTKPTGLDESEQQAAVDSLTAIEGINAEDVIQATDENIEIGNVPSSIEEQINLIASLLEDIVEALTKIINNNTPNGVTVATRLPSLTPKQNGYFPMKVNMRHVPPTKRLQFWRSTRDIKNAAGLASASSVSLAAADEYYFLDENGNVTETVQGNAANMTVVPYLEAGQTYDTAFITVEATEDDQKALEAYASEETGGDTETSSSGGGCNAGFSAFGLAAALLLKLNLKKRS